MSYDKTTWQTGDVITANKFNHIEDGIEVNDVSYEKNTWQTGDVITAEKLNHMEDGIEAGGGGFDYQQISVTEAGQNGIEINASTTSLITLCNAGKMPYIQFTEAQVQELHEWEYGTFLADAKYLLSSVTSIENESNGATFCLTGYVATEVDFTETNINLYAEDDSTNLKS